MFNKDILIPALIGLGIYSHNSEMSLCNNTTMLLALYVLLKDHEEIEELKCHDKYEHCCYNSPCNNGYPQPANFYRRDEGCNCRNHF